MLPESLIELETKGGPIDLLITQGKWGLELLRGCDHLETIQRIQQTQDMKEYLILSFMASRATEVRPGNNLVSHCELQLKYSIEY